MLTRITVTALLACVVAVAPAAGSSGSFKHDADALVAAGAPGVVLLVRTDGQTTTSVASGLGEVATKTPMRANDRFRVASLTKTYTATVVLQLVGEGRLSLGDSVERWLPGSSRTARTSRSGSS